MRQSVIAILAMALVLAIAAYEDFRSRDTVPKLRLSGTVSQWSALATSVREPALNFRLGSFPHEFGVDAQALALLAQQGMTEPLSVGMRVDAIIAKRELTDRESGEHSGAPIPVLALYVDGQPLFGSAEALRLAPSMRTWPYLLLLSAFGAGLFFTRRRAKRSKRRRARRLDCDEEDSSSG